MADRTRKLTVAPPPPAPIRITTRTGDIGQYGLPATVTKSERTLIEDAITAVTSTDAPTEMARLDLYLSELEARGLKTYIQEIRAARETLHKVIRAGGDWKMLMNQSSEHWVLNPMLMKLS